MKLVGAAEENRMREIDPDHNELNQEPTVKNARTQKKKFMGDNRYTELVFYVPTFLIVYSNRRCPRWR